MSLSPRPLAGCSVNLSISESDDSVGRGFPAWQVNRVTLQIVAALFGQGAGVVFGHDWREDGVMEAVHGFARQVQPPVPLAPQEAQASGQPLLVNVLPWPDKPRLPDDDLERLAATLRVERAGLPSTLERFGDDTRMLPSDSPGYLYLRARGLTHLRRKLNQHSQARICLGGRTAESNGRFPGVIEEAVLAISAPLPLYLAGLLGGATRQVIDAIQGHEMPPDSFSSPESLKELYAAPPFPEEKPDQPEDQRIDREAVLESFRRAKIGKLAEVNGLSIEENEELFYTPSLDRVIILVLTGLSRLQARSH